MGVSRNWEFPETSFKNPMQGRTGAPVCTARVSLLTSISSKFLYINHTVSLIFAIFQFEISNLINWIFFQFELDCSNFNIAKIMSRYIRGNLCFLAYFKTIKFNSKQKFALFSLLSEKSLFYLC